MSRLRPSFLAPLLLSAALGETELSAGDIERLAWDLGRDFQAARYNLLMCNCEGSVSNKSALGGSTSRERAVRGSSLSVTVAQAITSPLHTPHRSELSLFQAG